MNHYELLLLVPATITEEEVVPIREKVKSLIAKHGGRIILEDNLGKRKLAYPIKKIRHGYYLLIECDLEGGAVKALDNDLRLSPELLRHTIVKKEQKTSRIKPSAKRSAGVPPARPTIADRQRPDEKKTEKEKVKIEDLDKRLDEILEGDIL